MHVSRSVGLKKPARGRNATVKVIGRPKISKMKRNQMGAQLATERVDEGKRTGLTFLSKSCMRVSALRVDMTSVEDYAQRGSANEEETTLTHSTNRGSK